MNKMTYEIEAGEYALLVKYRSYNEYVSMKMGDNFSLVIPLGSLPDLLRALVEISREVDNKKFLQNHESSL